MKEKKLLINFEFFFIPMVEMLQEEIQSLCNFSFLKIVKIELANKVQSIFLEKDPSSARKTSLFHIFHFTNWNGMNQSFPCTYGPIYHGTIFFYFLEKYSKKFFVLPALPSNEKNSSDHHNSYNEGPILAFFSFTISPSNSLLTIKFPKNHIISSYHRNLPKTAKAIFGHQRALGIKNKIYLEVWGMGQGFGRMCVQHTHFLKLAPKLGSVKCSIPHGNWRFHFFSSFIFLSLEYTWTFISTIGIFVS
jgi:hypothetical protein